MNTVKISIAGKMAVALACAIAAALLAYEGKEGWSWFLFVTIWLGSSTVSVAKREKAGE